MTTPIQTIQTILIENSADSVLLQAYASAVSGTPLIDLSSITFPGDDGHVVADLKTDQTNALAAVAQASIPLDKWQTRLSDVLGFCNLWQPCYQPLNTLLNDLGTGTNKSEFLDELRGLASQCNQVGKGTVEVTLALNDFIAALANPRSQLRSDQVIVGKTVGGGGGTLTALQNEMDSLNSTMEQDNATISRGATKQAEGVLIIVVVVLAEIAKSAGQQGGQQGGSPDDDSGKIINASITSIKDDIKQQSDAFKQWNASCARYQALLTDLALDKLLYAAVNQLCNSLDSLAQAATGMKAYETQLQTAWNAVASALETVIAEVSPDSFTNTAGVAATLSTMNDQLVALNTSALALQQTGAIQVDNP